MDTIFETIYVVMKDIQTVLHVKFLIESVNFQLKIAISYWDCRLHY